MLTPEIVIATEVQYRNVERVWRLGYEGQGERVALIDTGVNPESLPQGAVAAAVDLTTDGDQRDHAGHGTAMAKYILGMAPKASVISVKVAGRSSAPSREDLVRALDHCSTLSPRPKFVNISMAVRRSFIGKRDCTLERPCSLCARVNALWEQDMVVVAAAGNFSSGPDSFACPAAARWAVKVRDLTRRDASAARRFLKAVWPSLYYGKGGGDLFGTSRAAAFTSGCLAVLASAFPATPAKNVLAVFAHTSVRLETSGSLAMADILRPGALGETGTANIYRAYVFLKQATEQPRSMDVDRSMQITAELAGDLRGPFRPAEAMSKAEQALQLDESNYLAYFLYSLILRSMDWNDKADELLAKANELLPPGEALEPQQIFGGNLGGAYTSKAAATNAPGMKR